MYAFYKAHKRIIDKIVFIGCTIAFVYIFFQYLFVYVAPFFFGLVISLIMEPLIRLLVNKFRFKRGTAAVISLLLFMTAMGSLGTVIVSNLYKQTSSFLTNAPTYIDELSRKLDGLNEGLSAWTDNLPDSMYFQFSDTKDTLLNALPSMMGDGVINKSVRIASNVPNFFIGVILTLVSSFFFMKDRLLIFDRIARSCPRWLALHLKSMQQSLSHAVGGYFRAQFIMMAIVGIISISGLLILRNPYALMIGLLMAMMDFLPAVGSGSILMPWAAYSFLSGQYSQAVGLLILYAVITVTRQSLEPKILGEQIGVHPLLTLMSIYIGYKIFGIFGIFIGPSLVIILKATHDAGKVNAKV